MTDKNWFDEIEEEERLAEEVYDQYIEEKLRKAHGSNISCDT